MRSLTLVLGELDAGEAGAELLLDEAGGDVALAEALVHKGEEPEKAGEGGRLADHLRVVAGRHEEGDAHEAQCRAAADAQEVAVGEHDLDARADAVEHHA